MTVDQVIDTLKLEKQQRVPSRFPCRAIMVGNIAEYCDLLEKLKTIPNVEVVPSDVLFSSAMCYLPMTVLWIPNIKTNG